MVNHNKNPFEYACWESAALGAQGQLTRPSLYLAVCGNTGSGKSTLVRALQARIPHSVAVDERALHHPLLPLMFSEPKEYAAAIQLNFLVQRFLLLRRLLSLGRSVLMERSHYDEALFIEHHLTIGSIPKDTHRSLVEVSTALHVNLPAPTLMLFLNADPEVSLSRLDASERLGERPREFPNDKVKEAYVRAWHKKYELFFSANLQKAAAEDRAGRVVRLDATTSVDRNVAIVEQMLKGMSNGN